MYIAKRKNYELKLKRKLLKESIIKVLSKTNLTKFDIDLFVSGDLLNQNVSSNYVAREFGFPFSRGLCSLCKYRGKFNYWRYFS